MTANLARNLWSYMIIFCGHFPDGALHFTEEELEDETRAEWYLRQMLGSANFEGGRTLHILSGSLGFQIEHHLFPDLPSNRYPEIAVKVRALCDKYDIPYTTGPLHRQYGQALRTIMKLSLPNSMTSSDEPAPPQRADTANEPERDRRRRSDAERPPRRARARRLVARAAGAEPRLMDAAPTTFAALPVDPEVGLPVPFACGTDDPYGAPAAGPSARTLDKRRVTQCALSRICGVCGTGARPADRLPRHRAGGGPQRLPLPAARTASAPSCSCGVRRAQGALLGQDPAPEEWVVVTTASFEFVRPTREDTDRRPTFEPHALLG